MIGLTQFIEVVAVAGAGKLGNMLGMKVNGGAVADSEVIGAEDELTFQ